MQAELQGEGEGGKGGLDTERQNLEERGEQEREIDTWATKT